MKFWTHPDYTNGKLGPLLKKLDDVKLKVKYGIFTIKYTGYDNSGYLGIFSWKGNKCQDPMMEFYEGETLLFTKSLIRPREFHPVIGGNGTTRNETYFIWYDQNKICVSDFNDKLIKIVSLGPDFTVALADISTNYFVSITEELCTYSKFFGLINKDLFFRELVNQNLFWDDCLNFPVENIDGKSEKITQIIDECQSQVSDTSLPVPYNPARIGLCVDWYTQCGACMEPIESTEDGLIFADVNFSDDYREKLYTRTEFVRYEDVASYDQ